MLTLKSIRPIFNHQKGNPDFPNRPRLEKQITSPFVHKPKNLDILTVSPMMDKVKWREIMDLAKLQATQN